MFQLKQISIKPISIKLKPNFKNPKHKSRFTEEEIFREATNKTSVPNNNHHNIETFIEATLMKSMIKLKKQKDLIIQIYL